MKAANCHVGIFTRLEKLKRYERDLSCRLYPYSLPNCGIFTFWISLFYTWKECV